jgi:hypothetical protein
MCDCAQRYAICMRLSDVRRSCLIDVDDLKECIRPPIEAWIRRMLTKCHAYMLHEMTLKV